MILFIQNVPFSAKRPELRQMFESYGPVTRVSIPVKKGGSPRGIAFVEMPNDEQAARAAVCVDGMELDGRVLRVSVSQQGDGNDA